MRWRLWGLGLSKFITGKENVKKRTGYKKYKIYFLAVKYSSLSDRYGGLFYPYRRNRFLSMSVHYGLLFRTSLRCTRSLYPHATRHESEEPRRARSRTVGERLEAEPLVGECDNFRHSVDHSPRMKATFLLPFQGPRSGESRPHPARTPPPASDRYRARTDPLSRQLGVQAPERAALVDRGLVPSRSCPVR